VLGLTPARGAATPRVPSPGAAGIGDPYWPTDGNGGYDVEHYDLRLSYEPATDVLSGVATLTATATQDLSRLNLDLDGLTVESVRVDRVTATWTRSADELQITPTVPLVANQRFSVMIGYRGVPVPVDDEFGVSGFLTTPDGAVIVGQPHVADTWFPANDHPADKATYRIAVTVPQTLQAVANGASVAKSLRGGKRTWTWSVNRPMASYLATLAIGRFTLRTYRADRIDYVDAIDPALFSRSSGGPGSIGARAEAAFARQPQILRFLSGLMGPYPFGQAGGIVDDAAIGFALENQTRPVYDKGFFTGGDSSTDDSVVVHELAHQWAGDSLALDRWSDIWLNEGFATYAEWRWAENQQRVTTDEIFAELADIPADDEFWDLVIGAPGAARIFDGPVYDRGAMTLHALRRAMGEADFATLTKRWFAEHRDGNVTTAQFIALAEQVEGRSLGSFFTAWLFTATKPSGLRSSTSSSPSTSPSTRAAASRLLDRIQARHAVPRR
jgi:aminopeptidase N